MVTIERSIRTLDGYTVKFSEPGSGWRSYSVEARSLDEAALALRHYYGTWKDLRGHDEQACPLCAKIREDEAKKARKTRRQTQNAE